MIYLNNKGHPDCALLFGHLYKLFSSNAVWDLTYCSLSKMHPWVMNFSGCSKWGVGIFSRTLLIETHHCLCG